MPLFGKVTAFQQPPPVPTDEVIPVHLFDGSSATIGITVVYTFVFDDVLDPDKLHAALTQLFQMDGWRKLSGRFRYRPDGGLEIHVPRPCTPSRPAIRFTSYHNPIPLSEHPLASKLPAPTGHVAVFPGPKEFVALGLSPGTPTNISEFIAGDHPQFCLHVQTFTDATLVNLTFTHVSTDLMGYVAILEGWSRCLAGRSESVKPFVGYRVDPFRRLWEGDQQRHVFQDRVLGGWKFKYWAVRNLYEGWRLGKDVQARVLCVPRRVMESMMRDVRAQVDEFVSEGNVLTALACQVLARYQGPGSKRETATIMATDPRSRVPAVFDAERAYVQNAPTNVYFFCRADKALEMALGELALQVRRDVAMQASEAQLRAAAALSVESMRTSKMPVIFGDKDMATQFMSNWSKGKITEAIDFRPAIVRERDAGSRPSGRGYKRGHPVYFQSSDPAHNSVSVISSVTVVMGRDYEGNTWFSISLPGKMWEDLLECLGTWDSVSARL